MVAHSAYVNRKAAHGAAWVWRLWCSIYIFTVRGSVNLKLRVDSAGSTISLLPLRQ